MDILNFFNKKKDKKLLKKEQQEQTIKQQEKIEQKRKEISETLIPTNYISLLIFKKLKKDTNKPFVYGSLMNNNQNCITKFDEFIPVIKSNSKYFDLINLHEIKIVNGKITQDSLTALQHYIFNYQPNTLHFEDMEFCGALDCTLSKNGGKYNSFKLESFDENGKLKDYISSTSRIEKTYSNIEDEFVKIKDAREICSNIRDITGTKTYRKIKHSKVRKFIR